MHLTNLPQIILAKSLERSKIKIINEDIYYGLINVLIPILFLNGESFSSFSELPKHLNVIKNLVGLNNEEIEFINIVLKMRKDFEYGRFPKISDDEFLKMIKKDL